MLALLWLGGALLALGPTLVIGGKVHVPLPVTWDGTRMSLLMPYTWLVHVPGLSALREADRLALLGLVGAAMLAGAAAEWLRNCLSRLYPQHRWIPALADPRPRRNDASRQV